MKFLLAIVVYLVIGLVLGGGIRLTAKGEPWLLTVGFLANAAAFVKLGCLPTNSY